MDLRLLLTPTEAAAALAVSRSTIYELLASGALASVHIGTARRIPVAALQDYLTGLAPSSEVPALSWP
ncbi:MAG: helix-turn-helix domain-containing protein [Mycobacteriales bacterium]